MIIITLTCINIFSGLHEGEEVDRIIYYNYLTDEPITIYNIFIITFTIICICDDHYY